MNMIVYFTSFTVEAFILYRAKVVVRFVYGDFVLCLDKDGNNASAWSKWNT